MVDDMLSRSSACHPFVPQPLPGAWRELMREPQRDATPLPHSSNPPAHDSTFLAHRRHPAQERP